jgi:hypothetical protein
VFSIENSFANLNLKNEQKEKTEKIFITTIPLPKSSDPLVGPIIIIIITNPQTPPPDWSSCSGDDLFGGSELLQLHHHLRQPLVTRTG